MSYDSHSDDDEVDAQGSKEGRMRRFQDFDCPGCNANNPYDDAFGDGDDVLCFYCGQEYKVRVSDEGRLRLQEA
jgi:transcription elongation factor Elf1